MEQSGTIMVFFDYPIKFATADERAAFDERLLSRLSHCAYAIENASDDIAIVELAERILEELDTIPVTEEQTFPVFDMPPLERTTGQLVVRLETF